MLSGCILLIHILPLRSQTTALRVMFYNVENLFDTINDPLINDEEFLPEGRYKWSAERYQAKLNQLARVISAPDAGNLPAVIGLCEIENHQVLNDLVQNPEFSGINYRIVHFDSPDGRGIDVALLYRSQLFTPVHSAALPVRTPFDLDFRTRDILYVQGIAGSSDTLHIYVNHWPSRRGGSEVSEPKRVRAAEVLRNHLDSVAQHFVDFQAIIMGDLNDEPADKSVSEVLGAVAPGNKPSAAPQNPVLLNYAQTIPAGEGTYYYWRDKKWNVLDHMILTLSLADSTGSMVIRPGSFQVIKPDWLLKEDQGVMIPFSTFARDYQGGFSDHLPVVIELTQKELPPPPRKCRWRKR